MNSKGGTENYLFFSAEYPFRYISLVTRCRVALVITGIWVLAAMVTSTQLVPVKILTRDLSLCGGYISNGELHFHRDKERERERKKERERKETKRERRERQRKSDKEREREKRETKRERESILFWWNMQINCCQAEMQSEAKIFFKTPLFEAFLESCWLGTCCYNVRLFALTAATTS